MWNVERVAEVALTFGKGVGLWREDDDKIAFLPDVTDIPPNLVDLVDNYDYMTICFALKNGGLIAVAFGTEGVGVASVDVDGVDGGFIPKERAIELILNTQSNKDIE